jgi:hypothetical protein
MALHLQYDWTSVIGEQVEIRNNGQAVRSGVVDCVTQDGSIVWLAAEGAFGREMVSRADGHEVWIDYKWERD